METRTIDAGGPVHAVDHGGSGVPVLLVHGLGGSHTNWTDLGPRLAGSHRVLAVDLVGHGFTAPAGRQASIDGHVTLVERTVDALDLGPVVLVGLSMGGLVAGVAAERSPGRVLGLVMIDPALPIGAWSVVNRGVLGNIVLPTLPGVGPALLNRFVASTTPEEQVADTLEFVAADPDRVSNAHREAAVAMARARRDMPWAVESVVASARSLSALLLRRRHLRRVFERITTPTLVVHGAEDRLVAVESALALGRLRPDWDVRILDGVGHVPPVEAPGETAAIVSSWIDASVPTV
ncbi:MAG: alpha/beta hydrolase [Acidimicrobiia bacterium]|nr:alpha/beta hydrolase [Acidimicrobiia bacterium]